MYYLILLPASVLLAAVVIWGTKRNLREWSAGVRVPAVVIALLAMLVAAFLGSLATLVAVSSHGPITMRFYDPPSVTALGIPIGFYIDRLSAVMMVLISGVTSIIYLFSIRYMQQEHGYCRFLVLLSLTTFVLLGMVSSSNLLMLFVFWQLLTWLLYLLAHNYAHAGTIEGAFKTFTMLRLADVTFLAGIVLTNALYGTLEFQTLFARAADMPITLSLWPGSGLEINAVTAVTLLIFIGAMGKSAQFPLHMWLPGSLYAPTPVHALLHAGIINAGGFLLNRLAPLYGLSPATLHVVFVIGAITAILGACMMLTQNDIKKTLGYSTIGQMGYMIMECGLGAFALAVFHLIAHGLFKATVFLNCGNVIHNARQEMKFPHVDQIAEPAAFSLLTWLTGFIATLVLPLGILLAANGILHIPLLGSQGTVIFLFFAWVTSSQAILTLTRLRAVASWKVAVAMLLTLLLVVFTYLLAAESFTHYLYPAPDEVARYFKAAALPGWLFDGIVVATTLLIIMGWVYIYAHAHERTIRIPAWAEMLRARLYVLFMNRLYVDVVYHRLGQGLMRVAHCLDKRYAGWLP